MSIAPVKLGVIGLGRFGRLHALTLAGLAEAELVGLVARRQASVDALTKELPGVPSWTSLKQAIDESDAEAWVVASTTKSHVALAKMLCGKQPSKVRQALKFITKNGLKQRLLKFLV